MMLQSLRGLRGFGQTPADMATQASVQQASSQGTNPLDVNFPWYCDTPLVGTLFEIFSSNCTPPTSEQLTSMQQAQLQQVANVNPAAAAQGVAAGNAATTALATSDPQGAAAYNAAINSPLISALFGTNAGNYLAGNNPYTNQPNPPTPATSTLLWVVGGVGVIVVLSLLKK